MQINLKHALNTDEAYICNEIVAKKEADQYVAGPVLVANEVDRQGHIVTPRDVQLAAWRWAANGFESNLNHQGPTLEPDEALVVESWVVNPEETGSYSLAGKSFLTTTWFIGVLLGDNVWKKVQTGELTGFSIEGSGNLEDID